ncbi:hypothetical protein K2Y00_02490 [Patescibacteria group bacterium]|nr:hypothetical protein [Patescibacteria group bacterium]
MKLSVKECLSFGWTTFKKRPWIFVKAGVALALVSIAFNIMSSAIQFGFEATASPLAIILFLIAFVLLSLVSVYINIVLNNMGVTQFYLRAHENTETLTVKDLWAPRPFWKYVFTTILVAFAFLLGIILLIVPGIIAMLMFGMSLYLVMDRGMDPVPAMKESARITKGNRWRLLGLYAAILGLNIVGMLLLVVGLLVTVPVTMLAAVHAYKTLAGNQPAAVV